MSVRRLDFRIPKFQVIIELLKVPLRTDSTNLASQDGTFSTPVRPYVSVASDSRL